MTFQAWKMVFLNSMTFHDKGAHCETGVPSEPRQSSFFKPLSSEYGSTWPLQATATSFKLGFTGQPTNGVNVHKIILKESAQMFVTQITGQFQAQTHASRQALRYRTRCK